MTAIWGPMGWITLHSAATIYPENPSPSEKQLMSSWLDMFRDTITCSHCKSHFTELLSKYRAAFPNMLQSRHEFAMFTFRAHNAVNKRLNKPIYTDITESMAALKKAIAGKTARDFRISYINNGIRHWRTFQDITGISMVKKLNEMKKIEDDYFKPRDTNFNVTLRQDMLVLPTGVLENAPMVNGVSLSIPNTSGRAGFRITANGLQLRR